MGFTIFYEGTLKAKSSIIEVLTIVEEKYIEYNWQYQKYDNMIATDIIDGETFVIEFNNLKLHNWVKYLGLDNAIVEQIFEVLRIITPHFIELTIFDDYGLWFEYIDRFNTDNPTIMIRELTDDENLELENYFYLPQDSNSILSTGYPHAILFFMIAKDINNDLTTPIFKDEIVKLIKEYDKANNIESLFDYDVGDAFGESILCNKLLNYWGVTKLKSTNNHTKQGLATKVNTFSNFIGDWTDIGFGGISSYDHYKLSKILKQLESQNYNFEDYKKYLEFIYAILHYLELERPIELINRKG